MSVKAKAIAVSDDSMPAEFVADTFTAMDDLGNALRNRAEAERRACGARSYALGTMTRAFDEVHASAIHDRIRSFRHLCLAHQSPDKLTERAVKTALLAMVNRVFNED